ncbi:MAG: VanZ family protein [Ignavibacteriaceae bacterium]|nr:MAG: VanZ family protein [Chlorobiota bacterium]KXK05901.1 MAG: VanZ like family protein [Chlorobi bacterium OLB4]MBV6398272.1 hypothetical protein [Ignavibacteria bacterium]MCC6886135.1 VanZ family protein [Ignavibacteriales bacterium]MCE7952613.1 VanZ family protein [Chlorobi bacterium CHB7]MDL1886725.1 VanZ family protein [Ignavibacteria bacterium CHB1]MEB2329607.1 VanZ family protein [Ignavibacteriaceae bacterium]OQY77754.1 MAG: hypothetical protein B6D43_04400 [Ignavibacteriales bact
MIQSKFIRYHLPVITFCVFIFVLSSIPGNDFPDIELSFTDKIVHILLYGILCYLFFYSLNNQNKSVILKRFSLEFAFLFSVLYGIADEFHQTITPGRSFELEDMLADAIGSMMVYLFLKVYRNKSTVKVSLYLLLLPLILNIACSSPQKTESDSGAAVTMNISSADAWYDLSPVVGDKQEKFRFTISLSVSINSAISKYFDSKLLEVRDFEIKFPDLIVKNKLIETRLEGTGLNRDLMIYHNLNEIYSPSVDVIFENAVFSFNVFYANTLVGNFNTGGIQIKKVY